MKARLAFTPTEAQLVAWRTAGWSTERIAKEIHCSPRVARRLLRSVGFLVPRGRIPVPTDDALLAEWYRAGWTTKEIGEAFHVSTQTVMRRLHAHGVTMRKNGDQGQVAAEAYRQQQAAA